MKKRISKTTIDLALIAFILIFSFLISSKVDIFEKIVELSAKYEKLEIDEIIFTLIVSAFCLAWFSFKRWHETFKKNKELQNALRTIKKLEGIIPICMHCKEIRDDKGSWNQLEKYISEHSDARFSHGVCEKCRKEHYPEEAD